MKFEELCLAATKAGTHVVVRFTGMDWCRVSLYNCYNVEEASMIEVGSELSASLDTAAENLAESIIFDNIIVAPYTTGATIYYCENLFESVKNMLIKETRFCDSFKKLCKMEWDQYDTHVGVQKTPNGFYTVFINNCCLLDDSAITQRYACASTIEDAAKALVHQLQGRDLIINNGTNKTRIVNFDAVSFEEGWD